MKTIQKIVMLTVLMATATSVRAQFDTTAWPDPWYLYHPKPDCAMTDPRTVFKTNADSAMYAATLVDQLNPVYHATENITLYGIAITMDTAHLFERYGMEDDGSIVWPPDTGFFAKLLIAVDSGSGINLARIVDNVSFFDCVVPGYQEEHRRVRHTKFRYYCDTLVDNMIANCWEFYFNEPHFITDGDSFYVAIRFGHGKTYYSSRFIIAAEKDDPGRPYSTQCGTWTHLRHGNYDTIIYWPHRFYKYWGYLFPIVGLRCTEPRGLKLERKDGDTAVFSWPDYNQAESYEVLVVNESTGDSTVHYLTPDDTAFTLTGIDSLQQYRVRVRKSCRYITEGYDSIVVSGWSSAVTLEAKTPPDTTVTDTTWIHRVDGADFTLKPNPARGRCLLELGSAAADGCEVEVTDMRGVSVLRRRVEPGARSAELDIATLPAGAYMVKLVTPQGIASRRLLVR